MIFAPERDKPGLATDQRAAGAFVPISGRAFDGESISNCCAFAFRDDFVYLDVPRRTVTKEPLKMRKDRFASDYRLAS